MALISKDIEKAASLLQQGKLVAIPTETVYGLAADIYNEHAVQQIFAVKQRPHFNPLIVHIPNRDYLPKVALEIPEKAWALAEAFWPGSLTLILKKQPRIPLAITAGKDTVAVRMPQHPMAIALLEKLPFPLAAPSANPFNRISPTTAQHVANYFGDEIGMVLDGGTCNKGIESTIVGFNGDEVLLYRFGSLAREDIEKVVGPIKVQNKTLFPKNKKLLSG
ncbi:MAG: L-threonylcarbamoyladenylate synthase [Luteibaculum sp.]